jgi:hypothetical protein
MRLAENLHSRGGSRMHKNLKKKLDKPLLGSEFQNGISVNDGLETTFYIRLYMKVCRGFQLRNWKHVASVLKQQRCPKNILTVIYHSWVKLKFARALRPTMSSTYVFIMKHCSDLEGQKVYDDCYEQFTEQPYGTTQLFYERRCKEPIYFRLMEYFYNEQPEWILPLVVFPRIDFEKSKMHYSDEPYEVNGDLIKEVHEKVFNYVYNLDIKSLFIPRGDLMQKYGSQKYNDGGVVKYDYERPDNSFDSSFKYQRFLTQPLTPREVWLPGKAIKQNNAFFMALHRQILQADPIYPRLVMEENHEYLKRHLEVGMWKFDISGFGFQFVREWLIAANNAIRELYPCSELEEQSEIFEQILNSVQVEMPDGSIRTPQRGIGLGYYEDLKTIVMMALLKDHHPISIYGDQGLIEKRGIEFAFELMKYSFIMNYEKVDEGASEKRLRWGGIIFDPDEMIKPRKYSQVIFGAFFSRHHWERKAALYSVSKHYPEVYHSIENRVKNMYNRIFGYEFYQGDVSNSFLDGGISLTSRVVGVQRLYNIRTFMSPINLMTFDPIYQTPFNLINKNNISFKESKKFQIKRKKIYKYNIPQDTALYDYVNPILEFNKKSTLIPRSLPRWADLNLILFSNMSSGAITAGLRGDEIQKAVERQHFSSDPFRARATGGYSFATRWRSSRPPPQEWLEAAELLQGCDDLSSMYVNRTDLIQNPMLMEDPMYYNDDLFQGVIEKINKRKRDDLSETQSQADKVRLSHDVREMLPSLIKRGKVKDFTDIIAVSKDLLQGYDAGYDIAESLHGLEEDDADYYADAIDMVDLS